MSGLRETVSREWSYEVDDDPVSSETTLEPDGEGARPWTPSVNGSLRNRAFGTTPVRTREEFANWSSEGWSGQEREARGASWEWSWSSWSGNDWGQDPWSSYLDAHRPNWRQFEAPRTAPRGYSNWSERSERSEESLSSIGPEDDEVPFPRLLSRRENSPEPKPETIVWTRAQRGGLASGVPRQEERRPLPVDAPQDRHPAQGDGDNMRLREPVSGCQGQVMPTVTEIPSEGGEGKNERKASDGQGGGSYLKLHSSFPPEFRARPGESWKDYWRAVEFWLASEGTNLPPAVRSSRLMQQQKERAAKIVAHLSVEDVACDDGVMIIKQEMEKSPIIRLLEHKEVDRRRQKFMKLARHPGESLESFINRASIYRHENDQSQSYKVGSKFYLGHLLDAAKLTRKDEALIKTAAGGLNDEGKVVNAMLELADQLEGAPGVSIGRGEPDLPDDDEFLVQKNRRGGDRDDRHPPRSFRPFKRLASRDKKSGKYKKWRQVFHAILEDDTDDSEEARSSPSEKEDDDRGQNEDEDESSSSRSEVDPEGNAPAEIFAQEYKAKRRVNELKQMRQFFQKGSHPDKTRAWVKEQQKKEPCFLCNKLGHWSQECPLRKRGNGRASHSVNVTAGPYSEDPGQWSLLEAMAGYMSGEPSAGSSAMHGCFATNLVDSTLKDHEVFWSMRELHSSLILDLGCMKSVAGTKWVNQHIQRLKSQGRWMKAVKERESFRFGDGHELHSAFSFVFEATMLGVQVVLRLSVVPGECPPLLSKPACTQLGMIIDTERHTVSSRKLKVKNYGLSQTFGGHYALSIAEFIDSMPPVHDPPVPLQLEAVPVYHADSLALSPSTSTCSKDLVKSWTRRDKGLECLIGPGQRGPPWHLVVRRTVVDSNTGALLVDEAVDASTQIRRPLKQRTDTTTTFRFRVPGSEVSDSVRQMGATIPSNSRAASFSDGVDFEGPHNTPGRGEPSSPPRHELGGHGRRRVLSGAERRMGQGGNSDSDRIASPATPEICYEETQVSGTSGPIEVRRQGEVEVGREHSSSHQGREGHQPQDDEAKRCQKVVIPGTQDSELHRGEGEADQGDARGTGRGARGPPPGLHGSKVHCDPRLQGDKSILGAEGGGSPRGVDELQLQPGLPHGGCGQADWQWRGRLRGERGDHGRGGSGGGETKEEEGVLEPCDIFYDTLSQAGSDRQGEDADEVACFDGSRGALPLPVEQVLGRSGDQLDVVPAGPALRLQVEDVRVDGADPRGREARIRLRSQMEKESPLDDASARATAGSDVGASGSSQTDVQRSEKGLLDGGGPPYDKQPSRSSHGDPLVQEEERPPKGKPSRGLEQKLKCGVSRGARNVGLLTLVAACNVEWVVMEIFPTSAPWHRIDGPGQWKAVGPLWDKPGPPNAKQCAHILEQVRRTKPDVVMIGPPAGPWSPWWQGPAKETVQQKVKYWPMWRLIWNVWQYQSEHHRLVLLQVPGKMKPPDPDEMRRLHFEYYRDGKHGHDPGLYEQDGAREPQYDVQVDMCQWGARDEATARPYKKTCHIEVNDPWWCAQLAAGGRCRHSPGEHQEVEGKTKDADGSEVSRLQQASRWTSEWATKLLASARDTLCVKQAPAATIALHQECSSDVAWEAVPVEVEQSPEGLLRHRLGEATGSQFDYIYFEGASGSLSRDLRSTLAKLHVALGHVSAEKLKRMLHLNGAKDHILRAVTDMRCQVCQSVTAPRPCPRAAYDKPQRFNERVVTDVFFIWDANKTKYAVVHAVDAFSLYQVATLMPTAKSDLVAHFLKNYWVGIFGPPEVLMSDAGTEYAADTEALMRAYDVFHEMVPHSAKWRMGLAERHGAILKLLVMKTICMR